MASERSIEGKTPNGGVKSTMYFQDDDGQPVEEDVATRAVIVEYGKDGNSIRRTYGTLNPQDSSDASGP